MRALVLSGGSIKGAFQAGAISEILNDGFDPRLIYGVSVGSLNGGFLADRAGAAVIAGEDIDWPKFGQDLVDFWVSNIHSFDDIGKERSKFGIFWRILRKKFDGLLKMGPVTELMEQTLSADRIRHSPANFHAGVVDLMSGDFRQATFASVGDRLVQYIIASTREPIIMPIHWIEGEPLVDGGVRNIAPLGTAIKGGAREITVIACQSKDIRPPETGTNYRDFFNVAGRSVKIMTNEIVNNDLKVARSVNAFCRKHGTPTEGFLVAGGPHDGHRHIAITEVRPDSPIAVNITDFDAADIARMIADGQAAARKAIAIARVEATELADIVRLATDRAAAAQPTRPTGIQPASD